MAKKITVIPGDGIGKEITDSAVAVLKKRMKNIALISNLPGKMPVVQLMTSSVHPCRKIRLRQLKMRMPFFSVP